MHLILKKRSLDESLIPYKTIIFGELQPNECSTINIDVKYRNDPFYDKSRCTSVHGVNFMMKNALGIAIFLTRSFCLLALHPGAEGSREGSNAPPHLLKISPDNFFPPFHQCFCFNFLGTTKKTPFVYAYTVY